MGVDASYLYGYGCDFDLIEWDIDFLKEKYKDKLNEKINNKYEYGITWQNFIDDLENAILNDSKFLNEILEDLHELCEIHYDEENYLTFNHNHINNLFPNSKLKDLDKTALLYAKELGIKNTEIIEWIEWGYFS